ncbi:MAG TPA: PAS domain S-box protein [Syntrophorhabdaceae bacterium]|nr:PAS domain S-box protein [Syntrophorhabdaceae bacterium]
MKRRFILMSVLVFTTVCLYLMYAAYNQVKKDAIRELNTQQMAHARLAKAGIEGFTRQYMNILRHMASHPEIISFDGKGRRTVDEFYELSKDDIRSIVRVDASGRFIYTVPENKKYKGTDISYRDFFKTMKSDVKPVVSDIITTVKGVERSIAFHYPVLRNGRFDGSIGIVVSIDDLSTRFLKDIRIGKTGYAWVLNRRGTEVYCPVPGHIGKSIYETSGRFPSVIDMAKEMMNGKEGTTTYIYDYIAEKETRTVTKHAVYMPVIIGDTFWSIVVATPENEALASMEGFRNRWLLVVALLIAGAFAFSFYSVRSWTIVKEARKRMEVEEALVRSAEKYRSIFDNAVEGIFQSTPEGRFISVNPAFAKMCGYDSPQEMAEGITDIGSQLYTDPADRDLFRMMIDERGIVENYEIQYRRRDGREIWVSLNARGIKDDSGKLLYYEGTVEDITERRTAETMLLEEMEFNRTLLQASPAFFVAMDPDGKVFLMNQSMLDTLGYTIEEVAGKDYLLNFVPQWERKGVAEIFSRLVVSNESTVNENHVLAKDGRELFVEWHGRAIMDNQGKISYFFGVGMDVTERNRAEEALYAEKEKLRLLSENAPFGMVLIGGDGRFTYLNNRFREIFGYDPADVPNGRAWFRAAYPDREHRSAAISAWVEDFRDPTIGERKPRTFTVTCRDGKQKTITFISVMLASGDYLMTCEDITGLRRLEDQLRQSQKMEAIGSLAGGIAHDFNNILTTIMGYASLLQDTVDRESGMRLYVDQILSASQKAANLTQSLLAFSRSRSITLKPLNVNEAVRGAEKLLKRLLTEDIELRLSLADGDATALADATQVDQILFNLTSNARDAMTNGGALTIKTEHVDVDGARAHALGFERAGRYIAVTVSDTGIGMDEQTREKIFDPFFTTKEVGRGTGLGLATVYGIVKQHNGHITVHSEPGKGTAFCIYLPAARPVADEGALPVTAVRGGKETILIAEDNTAVKDLIRDVLRKYGYHTLEAKDGQEAVELFEQDRNVDLVILDSVMPRKNGREALEAIKKLDPGIRVLFISGHTKDTVLDKGIAEDKFDFLPKPVSPVKLLQTVREILDRT